jgi:phosphohistidine phosphatase
MKQLILIRHAKAYKDIPGIADIDRPLAKEGEEQTSLIGKRLKKLKILPDVIYSSPAKRALGTAKRIAEIIDFPVKSIEVVESIYQSSVSGLLKVIKKIDDSTGSVILFGHNPEFFDLANHLASDSVDKFPTCGALCLELDITSWKKISSKHGKIVFFECP